jgi:hypothetical protein
MEKLCPCQSTLTVGTTQNNFWSLYISFINNSSHILTDGPPKSFIACYDGIYDLKEDLSG